MKDVSTACVRPIANKHNRENGGLLFDSASSDATFN